MKKILLVLAHPALEFSRNNKKMITAASTAKGIILHIRDLYELYPRFNINSSREQEYIEQHDIIILQHPFYWYSAPALMKQYIDTVFTNGWAYGKGSDKLNGKILFNALTTNGSRESYSSHGHNRFPIRDFLIPFNQLAFVCGMEYLPPFVLNESGKASPEVSLKHAERFRELLELFASGDLELKALQNLSYLNDFNPLPQE
jgi:glutathione-regulated potassium-efflux system ancillary protein KefG